MKNSIIRSFPLLEGEATQRRKLAQLAERARAASPGELPELHLEIVQETERLAAIFRAARAIRNWQRGVGE